MKGWLFLSRWAQRCPRDPQIVPAPCDTAHSHSSAPQLCTPAGRLSLGLCPVGCRSTAQLFVLRLSPFPGTLQCAGRVHTPSQFSHLSLLAAATWAPERPQHQPSLPSCHSGQCWDGFRINSCSQSCKQLTALGLAADKLMLGRADLPAALLWGHTSYCQQTQPRLLRPAQSTGQQSRL